MIESILEVRDISKTFRIGRNHVNAVRGVSFSVKRGSTFGIIGESGSGKSTVARCALHLIRPSSGTSIFDGQDLGVLNREATRNLRSDIGIVFQNPVAALNPRMTIRSTVEEPLKAHTALSRAQRKQRVDWLLDAVGLAEAHASRLPHQLSGGQCQRVGIARALATTPRFLILDEPTSALDVSVQAQILNLLQDLKEEFDLTYLMISHDLDVVRYLSDEVAVMYRGQIIESGSADTVLTIPAHEYTKTLLASTPGH
jgi:oligopeptide transport system ATP-binding protein